MIIETKRLKLRPFEDKDSAPFAAINGNPNTMRYFPAPLSRSQSDYLLERFEYDRNKNGFSFLATELKATGKLVGFIGIHKIDDTTKAALTGHSVVEIGWRLSPEIWGQGLAPEGANALIDYAWSIFNLPNLVAFTTKTNQPSRRVMEKIGMIYDPDGDFLHPKLPKTHPLLPHVLYRINNPNL